jgi:hypothetical protein
VLVTETLAKFFEGFGYSMEKNEWMADKVNNIVLCAHNIREGLHSIHAFLKSERSCQSTSAKATTDAHAHLDDAADPEHGDDATGVAICNMDTIVRPSSSVIPTEMVPMRTIPRNFPRKPYVARGQHKDNSKHWGQRKLLFTEIEFLTLHCPANCIVVYAGSAPGNIMLSISLRMFAHIYISVLRSTGHHIWYMAEQLFPTLDFILIDPAPFAHKQTPKIQIMQVSEKKMPHCIRIRLLLLSVSLFALHRNCSPTSSRKSSTPRISRTASSSSVTFVGLMLVKKPS